jgi:hypothetical protein
MRKQYYFRPSEGGFDAWDVDHLIELSASLPVKEMPLASIRELDTAHWLGADDALATVRMVVGHMQLINTADLAYPVILGADGEVVDGMHRVARCLLEGREVVLAVQFVEQPEPDYRDVRPEDLPYE